MSSNDTSAVHAGRRDLSSAGVHVPQIDLSSTYPVPSVEQGSMAYDALASGGDLPAEGSPVYQRLWNPTVARFEEAMAELECSERAVAFASGMAALSATLLATVAAGRPHVVAVRPLYGGSDHVLDNGLLGTSVTWATPETVQQAVTAQTGLVIVESPANPTLSVLDIADIVRQSGPVPVLVDNTFATPVLQQPLEAGASLVLHSATKFIGGHGDLLAGVIAANQEWAAQIRHVRALTGGLLHPIAAYEAHRGLQTLPVRMRAAQATAGHVAQWLQAHPRVRAVHYPGLADGVVFGEAPGQLRGPGALVAFELESYAAATHVVEHTRLITHAVSLGGVDSLIQHPASLTHRPVAPEAAPPATLVRLSVGLEDSHDLVADLAQALE